MKTSSSITKLCNAFVQGAEPALGRIGGPEDIQEATQRLAKRLGGLWVGGKVEISLRAIHFMPNGMNVALHKGLSDVTIRREYVTAVRRQFGWLTGLVVVSWAGGVFRFRCFGATSVIARMAAMGYPSGRS